MTRLEELWENREESLQIAVRHGTFNVRVFGSIDFLIDYDLNKITPWFPRGWLMDLEDLLGQKGGVLTDRGDNPLMQAQVLAEAKLL